MSTAPSWSSLSCLWVSGHLCIIWDPLEYGKVRIFRDMVRLGASVKLMGPPKTPKICG